jgi:hypothetical protein
MSIVQIKQLLSCYIIKDIEPTIINYIFMKCTICENIHIYDILLTCECHNIICDICIKLCIGCNKNICINCNTCDDCNTIYENSMLFIDEL